MEFYVRIARKLMLSIRYSCEMNKCFMVCTAMKHHHHKEYMYVPTRTQCLVCGVRTAHITEFQCVGIQSADGLWMQDHEINYFFHLFDVFFIFVSFSFHSFCVSSLLAVLLLMPACSEINLKIHPTSTTLNTLNATSLKQRWLIPFAQTHTEADWNNFQNEAFYGTFIKRYRAT